MKLEWIKSSYSTSSGPDCVEMATPDDGHVLVRDSKNPAGPRLDLASDAWATFLPYVAGR